MSKTKFFRNFIIISACIAGLFLTYSRILVADDYCHEVLNGFAFNPMNMHCVEYDNLAYRYKKAVSREEYDNAKTYSEILGIYKKFNEVYYNEDYTTDISIQGYKTYPASIVEIDGKEYYVEVYIDISRALFRPGEISKWCIKIEELEK